MANGTNGYNGNGYAQRYSTVIQTVTVVALFVGGFWAAVIAPIEAHIDKIERGTLGIREHDEFKYRLDQRLRDVVDGQINLLNADISKLKDAQVTRSEHIQHWNEYDSRMLALTNRLNELQKEFNGSYNVGDQIKNLQKQLDDLRFNNTLSHVAPPKT